ncbi:MAG: PTS galactosamine transporter subunit IIB [Culicoidibacterales bacterium]
MAKPNILLTRIDNRLVHGQVGVLWTKSLDANLIIVVDDDVAAQPVQQQLMKMTADASGVDIRFFTIVKTIEVIFKAAERQKILLICRTPDIVLALIDGGVPITKVNVGNMHMSEGKKKITNQVFINEQEKAELLAISDKGITVFIQNTPGDVIENITIIA